MALTMANATAVILGGLVCEDRVAYFTACYSAASGDADLQGLLTAMGAGTATTENVVSQLTRIGDSVQELQAVESLVRVTQTAYTPRGEVETTAEFQHLVP